MTTFTLRTPHYTLNDFQKVKNEGFIFELPDDTIKIVKKIAELVGDTNYIKTPIFKKKNKQRQVIKDPNFKPTVIKKEETDYEKNLSKITIQINKLSDKNYDKIKVEILSILEITKDSMSDDDFEKIGKFIFNIASSNSFYSHIYAKIYSELMANHEIFEQIIEKKFVEYLDIFNHIEPLADSAENYEEFCKINGQNDKRRSLSKFISSLLNCDVIQSEFVVEILETLLDNFTNKLKINDMETYCDEMVENLKIIINNSLDILKNLEDIEQHNKWNRIKSNILDISKMDTTKYQSYTKKTLFKFYDLKELLLKN
jgi:hypothetical protein